MSTEQKSFGQKMKELLVSGLIGIMILLIMGFSGCFKPESLDEINARRAKETEKRLKYPGDGCSELWIKTRYQSLYDPSSLDFDHSTTRVRKNNDAGFVTIQYRAKNAFGGTVLNTAECKYSLTTGEVLAILR